MGSLIYEIICTSNTKRTQKVAFICYSIMCYNQRQRGMNLRRNEEEEQRRHWREESKRGK